jgi:hypothetical protein
MMLYDVMFYIILHSDWFYFARYFDVCFEVAFQHSLMFCTVFLKRYFRDF